MNPLLDKYMKDKYGDTYEIEAESELDDRLGRSNTANLFANIGDAIAGQRIGSQNRYFEGVNQRAKDETTGALDKDRKQFMENMQFDQSVAKNQREADLSDANSASSRNFRKIIESQYPDIAKSYGADWAGVTAADQELLFKPLQLKEQQKARIAAAEAMAGQRRDAREEKREERNALLSTPYGTANSPDDAKQLKSAHESKANFDNKLDQLIKLRKKHGGGQYWNAEDDKIAKGLSRDLLLEYKNMAKLGVLSQSDEAIINDIIPADPLKFRTFKEAIQGQDGTLAQMENFKRDSDKDFNTRVMTRTRADGRRSIVKRQVNPKTGQTRVVYSDGTTEIEPSVAKAGQ